MYWRSVTIKKMKHLDALICSEHATHEIQRQHGLPSQRDSTWWVWGVYKCRSAQRVHQAECLSWPYHQQLWTHYWWQENKQWWVEAINKHQTQFRRLQWQKIRGIRKNVAVKSVHHCKHHYLHQGGCDSNPIGLFVICQQDYAKGYELISTKLGRIGHGPSVLPSPTASCDNNTRDCQSKSEIFLYHA